MPEREISQEFRAKIYFKFPKVSSPFIAYVYSETQLGAIEGVKAKIASLRANDREITKVIFIHTSMDLTSYSPNEFEDSWG